MYVSDFMVVLGLAGITITGLSILITLLFIWLAVRGDRAVDRERRQRIADHYREPVR